MLEPRPDAPASSFSISQDSLKFFSGSVAQQMTCIVEGVSAQDFTCFSPTQTCVFLPSQLSQLDPPAELVVAHGPNAR